MTPADLALTIGLTGLGICTLGATVATIAAALCED